MAEGKVNNLQGFFICKNRHGIHGKIIIISWLCPKINQGYILLKDLQDQTVLQILQKN